jgi:hypothetical protein
MRIGVEEKVNEDRGLNDIACPGRSQSKRELGDGPRPSGRGAIVL